MLASLSPSTRLFPTGSGPGARPQDQRLLFQLKKQELVEVLRSGDAAEALGATLTLCGSFLVFWFRGHFCTAAVTESIALWWVWCTETR